ncbi:hypothetical protein EMIT0111MI5_50014 [Burkholderia sp. IT-111MI5]
MHSCHETGRGAGSPVCNHSPYTARYPSSRIRVTFTNDPQITQAGTPADAGGTEICTRRACTTVAVSGRLPLPLAACSHA